MRVTIRIIGAFTMFYAAFKVSFYHGMAAVGLAIILAGMDDR